MNSEWRFFLAKQNTLYSIVTYKWTKTTVTVVTSKMICRKFSKGFFQVLTIKPNFSWNFSGG